MKIYGMNKSYCKGLYVVYVKIENRKYFHGAYRDLEKAQNIACKVNGDYQFIEG